MKDKKKFDIIFEDENILILNKPAGLLTIPDRYDRKAPNLRQILESVYGKIWVIHRLDRETSGVMVFAKDADSHRELNQQFQDNKVEKLYHVVVSGIVQQDEIKIDIPIAADPALLGKSKPSSRGKESLTLLKVLELFRVASLVECNLVTGRHHQIRVHCSAIGYPLLVDELYGRNNSFFLSSIKRKYNLKKETTENPIIDRVTMHAWQITLKHPVSGEIMTFNAPYPKDFDALIKVLKKYSSISKYL